MTNNQQLDFKQKAAALITRATRMYDEQKTRADDIEKRLETRNYENSRLFAENCWKKSQLGEAVKVIVGQDDELAKQDKIISDVGNQYLKAEEKLVESEKDKAQLEKRVNELSDAKIEAEGLRTYAQQLESEKKELIKQYAELIKQYDAGEIDIAKLEKGYRLLERRLTASREKCNAMRDKITNSEIALAEQDCEIAKLEVGYAKRDVEADELADKWLESYQKTAQLEQQVDEQGARLRDVRVKNVRRVRQLNSKVRDLSDKVVAYEAKEVERMSEEELFGAFKREYSLYTEGTDSEIECCVDRAVSLVKNKNLDGKQVLPFIRALATGSLNEKGLLGCLIDLFSTRERAYAVEHALRKVLNNANNDNLKGLLNDVLYKRRVGCSAFKLACMYA